MKKRILLFLPLLLILVLTIPVLADGLYRAEVVIEDTSDADRESLGVLVPFNTQSAIDMGFLGSDGLDSRFLEGTTERYFMVADTKLGLYVPELLASQEREYRFETGWTPEVGNFGVITGTGGFITVPSALFTDTSPQFDLELDVGIDLLTVTPGGDYDGPSVESSTTSSEDSTTATHTVDLPSNIEVGNLLLMVVGFYTTDGSPVITWPSGWTELDQDFDTGDDCAEGVAYRIADGTEESTVDVTTDFSATSSHQTLRISHYMGLPEISTVVEAIGDPNSASLHTSWETDGETLWIACFGGGSLSDASMGTYPTDYTDGAFEESSTGYSYTGTARRLLSAASEDPGDFDVTPSIGYGAYTVGIQGYSLLSLVEKEDCYTLDVTAANELTFELDGYFNLETGTDGQYYLRPSGTPTVGQRCDDFTGTIDEFQVFLSEVGNPTGTLYARVRETDDTLLGTLGSLDVSTISGGAWFTFSGDVTVTTEKDIRVTVEFSDDDSNYVRVSRDSAGVPDGVGYASYGDLGSWTDDSDASLYFRMTLDDTLVVTSVTSGDIDIWVDSGTLKFDVDSVTEDSIALPWRGDGEPDSSDLVVSMPYMGTFSLSTDAAIVTSHLDEDDDWTDDSSAYDSDTSTDAYTGTAEEYIELTPDSAVPCGSIWVYPETSVAAALYVDVYYSGSWHNIYSGNPTDNEWLEISIGSTETVSNARVKKVNSGTLRVYEFYFTSATSNEVFRYEPTNVIEGTTLVNEIAPGFYDSEITWGENLDLTITVGGLQSITSYTSESGYNATIPDVAPDLPDLELFPAEDAVTGLPWYDLVNPAAIGLEWSTNTLYSVLYIFIAIGIGVGVMIATSSALLGAIATGAGLAVAAGTGVTGWWILLVYAIFAASYLVVVRSV